MFSWKILSIAVILENWMGKLYYNKYLGSTNHMHVFYVRDELVGFKRGKQPLERVWDF